ncbi:hypothetical protein ACFVWX_20660 [Streptomyces sp. NPDC058220]|uniref:hypothetical protein n=1 Tax=unclassified Streptomyces TaxID=2593676 RepID=UPI0036616846
MRSGPLALRAAGVAAALTAAPVLGATVALAQDSEVVTGTPSFAPAGGTATPAADERPDERWGERRDDRPEEKPGERADILETGPGTPHAVIGLVLAGVAAVAVALRSARRQRTAARDAD